MYTGSVYPLKNVLRWTKGYILIFILISLIPVILFDILDWKWLHLPWLPIGLLGTAVAFIQGFKNNASYDRLWEGRKIWGGIVNTSRTFTVMIKDFINNDFADQQVDQGQLKGYHTRICTSACSLANCIAVPDACHKAMGRTHQNKER